MSRLDEIIASVAYISDALMAYRNIVETGRDCNQCGAKDTCGYVPKPGQLVRYNCPLYVGEGEPARMVRLTRRLTGYDRITDRRTRADENRAARTRDINFCGYDRQIFVENLGWLLGQMRAGVIRCDLRDGYVTLKFENGTEKKICVECDSYLGIIKDVLSHI